MKITAPNDAAIKASAKRIAELSIKTYRKHGERAALRCALGDAAGLLDFIADEIGKSNRSRGNIRKDAMAVVGVITSCANEVYAMRDLIEV